MTSDFGSGKLNEQHLKSPKLIINNNSIEDIYDVGVIPLLDICKCIYTLVQIKYILFEKSSL